MNTEKSNANPNIYIYIYFLLSRGEENNRKRAYTSTRLNKLKKKNNVLGFALLL